MLKSALKAKCKAALVESSNKRKSYNLTQLQESLNKGIVREPRRAGLNMDPMLPTVEVAKSPETHLLYTIKSVLGSLPDVTHIFGTQIITSKFGEFSLKF